MSVFTDKTAVIIGASAEGGSGWVIAEKLAEAGARVIVSARSRTAIEKLAKQIGGVAVACNVSEESEVIALVESAERELGHVDIAIHAAGKPFDGHFIYNTNSAALHDALEVNYCGVFYVIKHIARIMPSGGSIVVLTSSSATQVSLGIAPYACAKGAANTLVKYAALEYAPRGIRVNAIQPGLIDSPMTQWITRNPPLMEVFAREIPLGRSIQPEEIAAAALFFAHPDAYVTGAILPVDGGMHLRRTPVPEELVNLTLLPRTEGDPAR
jgi:3-oxoacyl-[acyl-carrier protein] reductase